MPEESQTLVESKDYTVEFENNVNAGVATAKVTFHGSYIGTMDIPFNILPKDVEKNSEQEVPNITVDDIPDQWCSKPIKSEPKLVVKDGETVLVEGKDYDFIYKDNECVGVATAIVVFKGNYTGTVTKQFNILHKDEPVFIRGKDPEIGVDGWKDYYQCPSCSDYFEDPEFKTSISDLEAWKVGRGRLPVLADVPLTGDSNNLVMWISLTALGLIGVISCTIPAFNKKSSDEAE